MLAARIRRIIGAESRWREEVEGIRKVVERAVRIEFLKFNMEIRVDYLDCLSVVYSRHWEFTTRRCTCSEISRVSGSDELWEPAELKRGGHPGVVRGRRHAQARRLRQMYEVDPLDAALPDHQPHPEGDVRGGQVHETESGGQTESLHQHLGHGNM